MVLGGDNPEHREPFESFMKEYLQTGKNIILTNISVGAETYPGFSAAFLIFLKKADPATRYDIYQQPSWFPAKSFILSGDHLTLSPILLSFQGKKSFLVYKTRFKQRLTISKKLWIISSILAKEKRLVYISRTQISLCLAVGDLGPE